MIRKKANPDKPNIVFILADDLGWNDVGYHGSEIMTPNIDQLASCGVELDQHYVCPVCTPTRASLLSGRYPGRFGRHATKPSNKPVFPKDYPTLATLLKKNGYSTGLFGKWHLGSEPRYGPNNYGFDTSYGSLAGGVDPYNHHYKMGQYTNTWHRNCELISEEGHVTDLIVNNAVSWIREQESPWFCYVPFTAVHIPVDVPSRWLELYAYNTYDPDPERDLSYRRYAAYASHMDWGVGQLFDILKSTCQVDNTIVIFSSDNGALLEENPKSTDSYPGWHWRTPRLGSNLPLRGQKTDLYEGGIRTPTIICWPGHLQPGKCSHPLYIADWMPTLTNLTGCKQQEDSQWDGIDIWDIIRGKSIQKRRIFWSYKNLYAIREGEWKLITNRKLNLAQSELYNIASDPLEKHDLASQKPEIVENMLKGITEEKKNEGLSLFEDRRQYRMEG